MKRRALFMALVIAVLTLTEVSAEPERISGKNRYETNQIIAKTTYDEGATIAVVVNGEDFPDALSASNIARAFNAPIILTPPTVFPEGFFNTLNSLGVKQIYIVGGQNSISVSLEMDLRNSGYSVVRLAGKNRYETNRVTLTVGEGMFSSNMIGVVSGDNYADAMSAIPYFIKRDISLVLTDGKSSDLPDGEIIAVGGGIQNNARIVERISGSNKYETSEKLVKRVDGNIVIASGEHFSDLLSALNITCKTGDGILLKEKQVCSDDLCSVGRNFRIIGGVNTLAFIDKSNSVGSAPVAGAESSSKLNGFSVDGDEIVVSGSEGFINALRHIAHNSSSNASSDVYMPFVFSGYGVPDMVKIFNSNIWMTGDEINYLDISATTGSELYIRVADMRYDRYNTPAVNSFISSTVSGLDGLNDVQKLVRIMKSIALKVRYAYDDNGYPTFTTSSGGQTHIPETLVVEGEGICDGYSKLLQMCLVRAGVRSMYVIGTYDSQDHAWNLVRIDGRWYHVDLTHADMEEGGLNPEYILRGNSEYFTDRYLNYGFTSECDYTSQKSIISELNAIGMY